MTNPLLNTGVPGSPPAAGFKSLFNRFGGVSEETIVVTPPETPPIVSAGGVGGAAWRDNYRKKTTLTKKKRTLLDELEDDLLELRARIAERPQEAIYVEPEWVAELRKAEAFAESALYQEHTLKEFQYRLALVRELLREMDDEDVILLMLH